MLLMPGPLASEVLVALQECANVSFQGSLPLQLLLHCRVHCRLPLLLAQQHALDQPKNKHVVTYSAVENSQARQFANSIKQAYKSTKVSGLSRKGVVLEKSLGACKAIKSLKGIRTLLRCM